MAEINIGVNLIEILTTGMYKDARTIFREYVQNSCDAIDKIGSGEIEITIESDTGYIRIEDNGCGIPASDFKETLRNIAQSEKSSAVDKGFRGIGKLCGLAYCDKLIFTATAKGENTANSMRFDAAKLQGNFYVGSKVSAYEMLSKVTDFSKHNVDVNSHGFKVELFGVNSADLLDAEKIIDYLSFVAPVPYSADFTFAEKIHAHAQSIGLKIDEYKITVNGKQVFKGYKNVIATRGFRDELFDVSFRNFYDGNNLLAWSWIGLTGFRGQIKGDIDARAISKSATNPPCRNFLPKFAAPTISLVKFSPSAKTLSQIPSAIISFPTPCAKLLKTACANISANSTGFTTPLPKSTALRKKSASTKTRSTLFPSTAASRSKILSALSSS